MALLFQRIAQGRVKNPMQEIGFMKTKTPLKPNSADTREWFRAKAKAITSVNTKHIINKTEKSFTRFTPANIGRMYMYFYDPKWKDKLPYYDRFPLIFVIELYKDGFLGINLHYLPWIWRAKLMDALWSTKNNRRYDESTKLKISYQILKGTTKMRMFGPCIKRYLYTHVKSNMAEVDVKDWDFACMLPTERFEKANKNKVFKESMNKIKLRK